MEDDSARARAYSITPSSQVSTGGVSEPPPFGAPGGQTEQVHDAVIMANPDPVPPHQASPHTAGAGDRGGTLHGTGTVPGTGYSWTDVNEHSSPGWTGGAAPSTDPGH